MNDVWYYTDTDPETGKTEVFTCPVPTIHEDSQGRIHSSKGKAVEWPDGFGFYYIHGQAMTEEEWKLSR